MNLTVYTGPCPAANIDKLFSRTPLRVGKLCVVVPDSRSVAVMERRLAELLGGAYTGHRVYTFEGLSKAIISQSGRAPETLGNHIRRALIGEIIKNRIGKQSRFYGISGYQGFVSLIGSFLEDVRSTKSRIITHDRELISIAGAYESHLKRLGVTDHEGLIRLALNSSMIERFAESFKGSLIVDGFYDLTEIQLELLAELFKHFGRSAVTLVNGESNSSLFDLPSALKEKYSSLDAKLFDVDYTLSGENRIILSGFLSDRHNKIHSDSEIELHTFRKESTEADWIAGRIRTMLLEGECRPEDIMIVSRYNSDFGDPIYKSLKKHEVPLEVGVAQPLIHHPLVTFVFDILEASINPLEDNIIAVQRSCYTGGKPFETDDKQRMYDDRAWSCMINEVDSPDGFVSCMKNIFEHLQVKSNLDGGGDRDTAVRENAVFEYIIEIMDEFTAFYSHFNPMLKNTEFNRLLRLFMSEVSIPVGNSPGKGVLVLDVEHARNVVRMIVFVKGFDNTSFPARNERYSLHDREIAAEISKHKDIEEALLFYMSISGAQKLFLTFPGIDDEYRDSSISPYLNKIYAGMKSRPDAIFHKGVPGEALEEGYVSELGKKENIIRALGNSSDTAASMLSTLRVKNTEIADEIINAVNAYIKMIEIRDITITAVENIETLSREWGNDRIYSTTDLERYISCPVDFFFSNIIALERVRELTDALDALEYGIIIHEALAEFYKSVGDEKGRTMFSEDEISVHKKRMDTIIDTAFSRRSEIHQKINPVVIASEKRFIKTWMHYFIETEAKILMDSPFVPFLFETSFGNNPKNPFNISHDGTTIKLRGRIDRIDISNVNGIEYFRVIDYKTGKNPTKKEITEGKAIQLPLYIKAVKDQIMPNYKFESGIYYNLKKAYYDSTGKKLKGCVIIDSNFDEIVSEAEKKAVGSSLSIREGKFPAPEKCSDYCEWRSLCRGNRQNREEDDNVAQ
ncbi:PD-(D/E)XK nuclease family protein [Candidatus Latescibacterota bacterium]